MFVQKLHFTIGYGLPCNAKDSFLKKKKEETSPFGLEHQFQTFLGLFMLNNESEVSFPICCFSLLKALIAKFKLAT